MTPVINKYFSDAEGKQGGRCGLTCTAMPLASVPKEAADRELLGTVLVLVSLM